MALDFDGDPRFEEAAQFDKAYRDYRQSVRSPELQPIIDTFARNMERLVSMIKLPVEMIWWTRSHVLIACSIRAKRGLHPLDESQDTDPSFADEFYASYLEWLSGHLQKGDEAANEAWRYGSRTMKILVQASVLHSKIRGVTRPEIDHYYTDGLQGILASLVTNGYSAFETLASDLWESSLNLNTNLATNYLEKNPDKSLKLIRVFGNGFDFTSTMGSFLKSTKVVNLQTFNNIKELFIASFGADAARAFDDKQSNIYKLEKLRHLFAHKAGLIDAKFISEMKDFEDYREIRPGTYFELNGSSVSKMIDSCTICSMKLFTFVDNWVADNR